MIVLSGADLVLPDRMLSPGTLVIDGDRIADVRPGTTPGGAPGPPFAFHGHYIVPGFIDVHVHGVEGTDTLDGGSAVAAIAGRLPRYGVTAFCPTTVACAPGALRTLLAGVRAARETPPDRAARVLPAHLESNFVSPEYRGAQPARCLRLPRQALDRGRPGTVGPGAAAPGDDFNASEILDEIERAAPDVGIVTIAPELDGALDLIGWLLARGHRVSLGHSAATFEEGLAAIAAGASQATHLFNRMPPLGHRAPGLAGAVLQSEEIAAEVICDGFHVHPALVRATVAAKRPSRVMAITDGTAASGMPVGRRTVLGGQPITVGPSSALLDDGTIAGSVLTMDRAFQMLVGRVGLSLPDAAALCATTPARELGLVGHGLLVPQAPADLVVLDAQLAVVQTYVAGQLVYSRDRSPLG
ncbi:MAG: N-acetylglucosamine-6-phosphate deacetylase [Betaproteobacteria bacterium]